MAERIRERRPGKAAVSALSLAVLLASWAAPGIALARSSSEDASGGVAAGLFAAIWALLLGLQACCWVGIMVISVGGLVLWILMLIDAVQRPVQEFPGTPDDNTRLLWVLIIALTGFIGATVYYFMVRRPLGAAGRTVPPA
jgi:hypothetical protein